MCDSTEMNALALQIFHNEGQVLLCQSYRQLLCTPIINIKHVKHFIHCPQDGSNTLTSTLQLGVSHFECSPLQGYSVCYQQNESQNTGYLKQFPLVTSDINLITH